MDTYRCFIAVDLPEQVKDILAEIRQRFKAWPAKVKWVERRNLHLTLKFLGDVTDPQISSIKAALARICSGRRKFEVFARGFGAFPTVRSPKVIWAGVHDPAGELKQFWSAIEDDAGKLGFPAEARPFSPHLTLGRVKDLRPAPGFIDILRELKPVDAVIPVTEVRLMQSLLSGHGPAYSSLGNFMLS